jgi:hypothetical protein
MSKPIVFPVLEQLTVLNAMVTLAAWVGAKLHLFSNNLVPTENNLLADFTSCVFSGYAPQTVTWSAAFLDGAGNATSSGGELLFADTGATPDVCYGFFLTDAANAVLLAAGSIDGAPFGFSASGITLPLTIKIGLGIGLTAVSPTP